MPGIQAFPYLRPLSHHLPSSQWLHLVDGDTQPLLDVIPHWDPGMSLSISTVTRIDTDAIKADCQLAADDHLRLALVWSSQGTGLRGRGDIVDLPEGNRSISLDLTVDGTQLAEKIRFELQLILAQSGKRSSPLAPRLPGSILWREERQVTLEGQGTRFPTECVSFAETQWLPPDAAWFLDWDPKALDERTLGSVRLFLNRDHRQIRDAVASRACAEGKLLRKIIMFDVGRTMMMQALSNEDFVQSSDQYEEGSVGAIIRHLLHAYFPNDSIAGLAQRYQNSPTRFACELQACFGLFKEV